LIREKAEKRQVERGSGALRGLAADVSRTGIDYELETGRINLDPGAAARAGIDHQQRPATIHTPLFAPGATRLAA
jgi:hypothetical protein